MAEDAETFGPQPGDDKGLMISGWEVREPKDVPASPLDSMFADVVLEERR